MPGHTQSRTKPRLAVLAMLILAAVSSLAVAQAAGVVGLVDEWGAEGTGDGQFSGFFSPGDLAVDRAGNVYAVDTGNDRVQKFAPDGSFLTKWGAYGQGNGQFSLPSSIAVDAAGNVYVTDSPPFAEGSTRGTHRIQKFTAAGAYRGSWDTEGPNPGVTNPPVDIATDSLGNVYVSDSSAKRRIQVFDPNGVPIRSWGTTGSGPGQIAGCCQQPGIAIDRFDNVYVADSGNRRILKFTSSGALLRTWGRKGSGPGEFSYLEGIVTDLAGNVYVADTGNHRIQQFTSDGALLGEWGEKGSGPGELSFLGGIAVDSSDNVYAADGDTQRIKKFAPESSGRGLRAASKGNQVGIVCGKAKFHLHALNAGSSDDFVRKGDRACMLALSNQVTLELGGIGIFTSAVIMERFGTLIRDELGDRTAKKEAKALRRRLVLRHLKKALGKIGTTISRANAIVNVGKGLAMLMVPYVAAVHYKHVTKYRGCTRILMGESKGKLRLGGGLLYSPVGLNDPERDSYLTKASVWKQKKRRFLPDEWTRVTSGLKCESSGLIEFNKKKNKIFSAAKATSVK